MRTEIAAGFYTADELSNHAYHSSNGISNSGLKLINERTPYHFWSQYINPDRQRQPTKPQMLGTALHAATLEPSVFASQYVAAPFAARNAAGYKAWAKDQTKHILMPGEMESVVGMHASLHQHPISSRLVSAPGGYEQSLFEVDPETEVMCKVRFDHLLTSGWILDLKKTTDASELHAAQTVSNYLYHQQAAFYCDVFEWAAGTPPEGFAFIFVEETPPYAVAIYLLEPEDLARGRFLYRKALNTYADCLARNHWPSYPEHPRQLALPYRERARIDRMRELA
jgi:hypothetical protein